MKPAPSSTFKTLKANPCQGCKSFVKSPPVEVGGLSCIGGCAQLVRVGFNDSGRVYAHHLPPCLVWRYTGDSDK